MQHLTLEVCFGCPLTILVQRCCALLQGGNGRVNSNVYEGRKFSYRMSKMIVMLMRGRACFDFDLYHSRSLDLAEMTDKDTLWDHFVKHGQFEGRIFR